MLRDLRNLEPGCARPPSYSAVRSYLQQLPKPLLILSREGKRQFQERCEPYLLTDLKLIESWFGTVRKRFDCLWPSNCGPGPKDRPEQCTAALKEHQAFLKGKRKNSPLPLASEFIATARQWIAEYNSQHPHGGRAMRGRTPDEVYNELLLPGQKRLIETPDVLYALFWDRQRRKVSEGGCVQLYLLGDLPASRAAFAFARRPAAWLDGRCLRGLPVLVHEASRRVWGLRLRRTGQKLALALLSMLPSAHINRVGVRVVCFRSSIAHPAYTPVYASLRPSR